MFCKYTQRYKACQGCFIFLRKKWSGLIVQYLLIYFSSTIPLDVFLSAEEIPRTGRIYNFTGELWYEGQMRGGAAWGRGTQYRSVPGV